MHETCRQRARTALVVKSYLINMSRDTERLAHMSAQFTRLGMAWERVDAVDMRASPAAELDRFRRERSQASRRHEWTPGQIGCLGSQMEAWRRIGAGDEPWDLVFEDDVHIDPRAVPMLRDSGWIPPGVDIVRFETTREGLRLGDAVPASLPPPFRAMRLRSEAWGAAAYAIRRDVARWLACTPPELQAPTDWLLFHRPSTVAVRLRTLQVVPAPCIQDQFLPASFARIGFQSATDPGAHGRPATLWKRTRPYVARLARRFLRKQLIDFSGAAT